MTNPVICLDIETYYSDDYTLRKMTPVEYALDPRFEAIGCAVANLNRLPGDLPAMWLHGEQLPGFFRDLDPDATIVTHNALFDMCIFAWRYGYVPRRMVDTMGMARALLGHELKSLSLASVAAYLGLGAKGGTVHQVKGMNAAAIRAVGLYDAYADYSLNDAVLTAGIYNKLIGRFPPGELEVMDMVLRCAVQPQLRLDTHVLAEHLGKVKADKAALLARVNANPEQLRSNDQFAVLLQELGVDPPRKVSLLTGKETWAFAKSDEEFMALEEHENPQVQALIGARLGHKTSLEETRTKKFLSIANLSWPAESVTLTGNMPIPLRYSGAHTHRLSGDWKLNLQNLPRGGALKRALTAPEGYLVVDGDASAIEARIVAWICGEKELVGQFERGEDVYCEFASHIFDRLVTKADKVARFVGKTCILGLGYGVGWRKLQSTLKRGGAEVSEDEARRYVSTYRRRYDGIPGAWRRLNDRGIPILAGGSKQSFTFGPCEFTHVAGTGYVQLPSGLTLAYKGLSNTSEGWSYTYGYKTKRLYGGALLENIVQALARVHVMDAAVRIQQRLERHDLRLALQVHDSLVYVVPEKVAPAMKEMLLQEMRKRPAWAQDLPLDAEVKIGATL